MKRKNYEMPSVEEVLVLVEHQRNALYRFDLYLR